MPTRLDTLLQLLEADSRDSFTLFALAKEYESQEDTGQALNFYLRLKEQDAGYVGVYYHLGKLFEKLEQSENALLTYQEGLEVAKKAGDRHAWSELQGAFLEAGGEEEE